MGVIESLVGSAIMLAARTTHSLVGKPPTADDPCRSLLEYQSSSPAVAKCMVEEKRQILVHSFPPTRMSVESISHLLVDVLLAKLFLLLEYTVSLRRSDAILPPSAIEKRVIAANPGATTPPSKIIFNQMKGVVVRNPSQPVAEEGA